MILGLISFIINVIGVILFFTNNSPSLLLFFTIVGGSLCLIENAVGVLSGEQTNLFTIIVAIIISFLVYRGQLEWWLIILIGAMFESVVVGVFSIPAYITIFTSPRRYY